MLQPQAGILPAPLRGGRYLYYRLRYGAEAAGALRSLTTEPWGAQDVLGLAATLVTRRGGEVEGLRSFPDLSDSQTAVPWTPHDLWVWVRADDIGAAMNLGRRLTEKLKAAFELVGASSAHLHGHDQDLSSYHDGTENPEPDEAPGVALIQSGPLQGGSFVAVQRWEHHLEHLEAKSQQEQDLVIGRRLVDDSEIEDPGAAAHIKRTEQESFEPEAHLLRRSLPFVEGFAYGLEFVCFASSLDAFEVQLRRMVGCEDGILDAIFSFSSAINGGYYFCPPVKEGPLDLSFLGAKFTEKGA
ncbi:MAG: Dyp-type peroxidase [Polyangiaceae bacterium]|nr:Dyp-type peroxidase [Polyangiaceae bacterium]